MDDYQKRYESFISIKENLFKEYNDGAYNLCEQDRTKGERLIIFEGDSGEIIKEFKIGISDKEEG